MASALIENLSAASALATTDLFYVKQAGARGVKATGTQLLALVGTAYVPLAGGTMTGALTIASGTLTASAPALNITQTWNNAGVSFESVVIDVTNTASSSPYFANFKVSGTSKWRVNHLGQVVSGASIVGTTSLDFYSSGLRIPSGSDVSWTSGAVSGTADLILARDAAASLALRNGTNQQSFSVYNSYTDPSNYERLKLTGVAGTSVNIKAETLGTGGDNLDIVLTPAGTGGVAIPLGASATPGLKFAGGNAGIWFNGTYTGFRGQPSVQADFVLGNNVFRLSKDELFGWCSSASPESTNIDAGLYRNAANVVEVNTGTKGAFADLKLRNLLQTEYHEVAEMTAPSAPARHFVRIYAEDNGSGKTRLMALFNTGAAQQLAIES